MGGYNMVRGFFLAFGFIFGNIAGTMYKDQKFMLECDVAQSVAIRSNVYECKKTRLKNEV
jgi:hypothetical protein